MRYIILALILLSTVRCEEIATAAKGSPNAPAASALSDGTIESKTRCVERFAVGTDFVSVKIEKAVLPTGAKVLTCSLVRHTDGASLFTDTISSNSAVIAGDEAEECLTLYKTSLDNDGMLVTEEAFVSSNGLSVNNSVYAFAPESCSQVYPK